MIKFYRIFVFIILISLPSYVNAHVEHYKDLNKIEFDIFRNGKLIGEHIFSFKKFENLLKVKSLINFEIKKLGVVLYKYNAEGVETYENNKLVHFKSKTNQNKKEKYVNLKLEGDQFVIDGSSYKGKTPSEYILGTWWNHSIVKAKAQISAVSGRIIDQKVEFLGKETLVINGKTYDTLHFNFSSTDKKLKKNKKLNTDVWYDEKSLNWVKASFDKSGKWEYKLRNLE
tara:strand:+ start:394 stop:1077 length:684 start_codon:yes stop_codon:yes gene_type:complete